MAIQSGGAGVCRRLPPKGSAWPFPSGLSPASLARLRCWDVLEGLTRGQAHQEQLPGCSLGVSVAFLWSVLMGPGEACELWVKSDSRIPLGVTQRYCAP